jgi:diguanylate cyclase (GGDEF)-like protein
VQDRKVVGYMAGSAEYIQILARRAGIVFAVFIGVNSWILNEHSWKWTTSLAVIYAIYNIALGRRQILPGVAELFLNLAVCAGLTYLQAEYSSVLYQLLLLRVALRVGRNRTGRVAVLISSVYLLTSVAASGAFTVAAVMQWLYNLVGFTLLTYGVIYIDTLASQQANDSRQMLELIKQNDRNYRMALTDALTGLYNHRAYKDKIENLSQYVLLVIDIDHFKKLNDTYGHLVGDKVLITIGNILKISIRSGDLAFRYGGEEFVVVLPGTTAQIGQKIAERLRQKIAEWSFDHGVPVTVSVGAAVKKPGINSQTAFEQADSALYRAKQTGRNNVQFYTKPLADYSVKYGM